MTSINGITITTLFCIIVVMVTELASLTPAQLMEKIRGLQNMAYQLGIEEGKEGVLRERETFPDRYYFFSSSNESWETSECIPWFSR